MNCQHCGAIIPRDGRDPGKWRRIKFCTRDCAINAKAIAYAAKIQDRLDELAAMLDDGVPVDDACARIGLSRKTLREHCTRYGRPKLHARICRPHVGTPPKPVRPVRHGTDSGYQWHLGNDGNPCDPCRAAHYEVSRARSLASRALGNGVPQIRDPEPGDWAKAVCRSDPDAWFATDAITIAGAKEACRRWCPLREACLRQALAKETGSLSNTWGIWGGMTPVERRRLRKRDA